ncbi:C40 family peptidase [Kitasatospora sp. NPDC008050]|uniref:C40 family peptidase n=1 Tax=Kitasatospora sp. NPDC008050 TaxID=3364021 RepID=UPI0036E0DDB3
MRGAVAAAVGAAALVAAGAGPAAAEPAPSHAGWDGSKYWFKDGSGGWRWTKHYDKYLARTGGSGHSSVGSTPSAGSSSGRVGEPTFRGRQGWDAADRVYWYQKNGHWYWTSHQDKYERYVGRSSAPTGHGGVPSQSPGPASPGLEAAVSYAMAQLGDPYVWGGNGPDAWDCSGLVQQAYRRAGHALPRVAADQYRATTPISRSQLQRGDLVFWSGNGSVRGIHHVAIYLGDGRYLESPRPGKTVRISSFDSYSPNLYGRVG